MRSVGGDEKVVLDVRDKKGGDWEWVKNGRGVQGKKQGLKKKLGRRVTILFLLLTWSDWERSLCFIGGATMMMAGDKRGEVM